MLTRHRHRKSRKHSRKHSRKQSRTFKRKSRVLKKNSKKRRVMRGGATDQDLQDNIQSFLKDDIQQKTAIEISKDIQRSPELNMFFSNYTIDRDQINRVLQKLNQEQYIDLFTKALVLYNNCKKCNPITSINAEICLKNCVLDHDKNIEAKELVDKQKTEKEKRDEEYRSSIAETPKQLSTSEAIEYRDHFVNQMRRMGFDENQILELTQSLQ